MTTNKTEIERRVEEEMRSERAAAQKAAAERVPAERAELAEAEARLVEHQADRRQAEQDCAAAEADDRAAMTAAVGESLNAAMKRVTKAREALKAAELRRDVAQLRADASRCIRDALAAKLAESEITARGYGGHLIKRAANWIDGTDLKTLVRRRLLGQPDVDLLHFIAAGKPLLDGARIFGEVATRIVDAEAGFDARQ